MAGARLSPSAPKSSLDSSFGRIVSKMEINNLLKDVININEYKAATRDVRNKFKHTLSVVAINLATVRALKKIRSLEIEYLNQCNENGVACIIFERLLTTPPSKVWRVLAKELVYLLQYWLEAIRKHLVNHSHSPHWWMFLKLILKFIKELRLKAPSIPNMLVEVTAECLFELATSPALMPDVYQRYEILHCLNMICAESSKEIRFAMRMLIKFGEYFTKIASQMATSGFLPAQYEALECLLRWLVPGQDRALRAAAAEGWLPESLCPLTAKNLFINSSWMNFFQDARNFLNALNEGNGLVKSVICRRLCIGEVVIINGTEKQQSWLDFNTSCQSVSVLLEPSVLEEIGVKERACETLMVDYIITETAILHRESQGVTISIHTHRPPYFCRSGLSPGSERLLTAVISSRTDLRALDHAMRNTFGDKYQVKEREAALPRYELDREPVSVCAQPAPALYNVIDDNIVQEAMQAKPTSREVSDSNINTDENKSQQSEALEDIDQEFISLYLANSDKKTDETSFQTSDVIDNRLVQEAMQAKPTSREVSDSNINTHEKKSQQSEALEDIDQEFLSQCLANIDSGTSDVIDDKFLDLFMDDDVNIDVEQYDMVDKVCSDFDKCTEYLFKETDAMEEDNPVRKTKTCIIKKAKNAEKECNAKMSTIVEQTEEDTIPEEINHASDIQNMVTIPEEINHASDIQNMVTIPEEINHASDIQNMVTIPEEMNHASDIQNMVTIPEEINQKKYSKYGKRK